MTLKKILFTLVISIAYLVPSYAQVNLYVGTDAYSEENIKRRERDLFLRQFATLLLEDKKKSEYVGLLSGVNPFPAIDFKKPGDDYLVQYDEFVKSLMPYMLAKIKNKDMNGEFTMMYTALNLSKNIEHRMELTPLEKTTFDFLYQNVQTEKALRACSQMLSRYNDKQPEIDLQLNRIEPSLDKRMAADLKRIQQDLYFINSDLRGAIAPGVPQLKPMPNVRGGGRMPASVKE
jgi:hypothetical protein